MPVARTRRRKISIHAPAWGATLLHIVHGLKPKNFNPRSRMGSDNTRQQKQAGTLGFQSTLPHGERLVVLDEDINPQKDFNPRSRMGSDFLRLFLMPGNRISIHAPAWGATLRISSLETLSSHFNPRSRMGSDSVRSERL